MGRRKKKFVDKRRDPTFHVVPRLAGGGGGGDDDDDDDADGGAVGIEGFVEGHEGALDVSPFDVAAAAEAAADAAVREAPSRSGDMELAAAPPRRARGGRATAAARPDEYGLLDDGYDYMQHLRMMGAGAYVPADAAADAAAAAPERDVAVVDLSRRIRPDPSQPREYQHRQRTDLELDADIARALASDEDVEAYDELDDDFIGKAGAVLGDDDDDDDDEDEDEDGGDGGGGSGSRSRRRNVRWDDADKPLEGGAAYAELMRRVAEATNSAAAAASPSAASALEAQLDALMDEYDDANVGDAPSDDDDPELRGERSLGDFASVFRHSLHDAEAGVADEEADAAAEEEEEDAMQVSERHRRALRPGETFEPHRGNADAMLRLDRAEVKAMALRALAVAEASGSREAPLVPLRLPQREQWDAATIVSTYTNTENHPSVIEPTRIHVDRRGMPVGYGERRVNANAVEAAMSDDDDDDDGDDDDGDAEMGDAAAAASSSTVAPRARGETREAKAARKQAAKEARRAARDRKRKLKGAYREEEKAQKSSRARSSQAASGMRGVSVYSMQQ